MPTPAGRRRRYSFMRCVFFGFRDDERPSPTGCDVTFSSCTHVVAVIVTPSASVMVNDTFFFDGAPVVLKVMSVAGAFGVPTLPSAVHCTAAKGRRRSVVAAK